MIQNDYPVIGDWFTTETLSVRVDAGNAFASIEESMHKGKRDFGEIPHLPWPAFEMRGTIHVGKSGIRIAPHFLFIKNQGLNFTAFMAFKNLPTSRFCILGSRSYCSGDVMAPGLMDLNTQFAEAVGAGNQDPTAGDLRFLADNVSAGLRVALTVVKMLNCKNVGTRDVVPDERLKRSREKKGKPAKLVYKTLTIDLAKTSSAASGRQIGDAGTVPLHICRGHFRTYSSERPLFGKVTGTFWIPMFLRGDKVHGEVVKDYRITNSQSEEVHP